MILLANTSAQDTALPIKLPENAENLDIRAQRGSTLDVFYI